MLPYPRFSSYQEALKTYSSLSPEEKEITDETSWTIWSLANIPLLYQKKDLERDWYGDSAAKEMVLTYLSQLDNNRRQGLGLHFWGSYGTGKTLLACYVLREVIRSFDYRRYPLYTGYFTTFSNLLTLYTDGWHDKEARMEFSEKIKGVDFLVIDDLGKEFRTKTNLNQAALDTVLRDRVYAMRPIIITTNRTDEEIEDDYGIGTMSLFDESCIRVEVSGEDFRSKMSESR
jgi:DNA replication protein DnaC